MPRILDQAPNPKSHIKTLMRIGYTLNSAVADVIDNSITAGAENIEVFAPPGLPAPIISILDDGLWDGHGRAYPEHAYWLQRSWGRPRKG
jgi:hypothetical protein